MKKLIALLLAMVMVLSFAACGKDSAPAETAEASALGESDLAYIKEKGTLLVGVTEFEPMDYKDENGEWTGFDAELARMFAAHLGVTPEFVEIDWDNKAMELDGKSIDCVWNGMTLSSEVLSAMDCSKAYLNNAQVVVLKEEEADKYHSVDDLLDLSFAVEAGSAGRDVADHEGLNYTEVQNQAAALMEVAAGTSDAAIIDALMAAAMVGEGTSYTDLTYSIGLNKEEYGVGFRKGSDLPAEVNRFIAMMKKDGSLKKLARQYRVQAALR